MSTYKFSGNLFLQKSDFTFEAALAAAYQSKARPLCVCVHEGIPMYVAKIGKTDDEKEHYIIKRMPLTGWKHGADCDSFEPPAELSGLGEVEGQAITENVEDGKIALKLDFSLSKGASRKAPTPSDAEVDTVRTDGKKLTLRGMLHFLWEQGKLNRWYPAMAGKRNWFIVRRELMKATADVSTKGENLAELLYVPENYNADKVSEITARRNKSTARAHVKDGKKNLMMVVGEIKAFSEARYGFKAVIKHLPDFHFFMAADLMKRLQKRFALELELHSVMDTCHLITMATFSVGESGFATVEEMTLMTVDEHWLPFESKIESDLIKLLVNDGRKFIKGLRYNMDSTRPIASVLLNDTPTPTAMYLLPQEREEAYDTALAALRKESHLDSWVYDLYEPMPPLPPIKSLNAPHKQEHQTSSDAPHHEDVPVDVYDAQDLAGESI